MGMNAQDAIKDKITGEEEVEELDGCVCKGPCLWMEELPRIIMKSVAESLLRAIASRLSLQSLVLQGGGDILKYKFWPQAKISP